MNLRWLAFDYADPELPLSFWQRVRTSCRTRWIWKLPRQVRKGRYALVFLVMAYWILLTGIQYSILAYGFESQWFIAFVLAKFALFYVAFCIGYGVCCRKENRYRIRLEGFDVCIECGYWLRELGDDIIRCPECGADRRPMPETNE